MIEIGRPATFSAEAAKSSRSPFLLEIPLSWIWWGVGLVGGVSFFFGVFTALFPGRSIALYEWLMAQINWRVSPIDEARELRTTRLLGLLLILLSLALWAALFLTEI